MALGSTFSRRSVDTVSPLCGIFNPDGQLSVESVLPPPTDEKWVHFQKCTRGIPLVKHPTEHCTLQDCTALQCPALHCNALNCTAQHNTAANSNALNYALCRQYSTAWQTLLYYTTLEFTEHWLTLHNTRDWVTQYCAHSNFIKAVFLCKN